MKEIGKILIYLIATIVLGALIAPGLYWVGQQALGYSAAHGFVTFEPKNGGTVVRGSLSFLASDFQRYFNRAMLIAAVALLWPLARGLRISSWEQLGLRRDPRRWRRFLFGFLVAAGSLVLMGTFVIFADMYHFRKTIPWKQLAFLPVTAIVVSLIEEFLFRGVIQGAVQRTAADYVGTIFVSAIFAIIHFIKPPEHAIGVDHVTWLSGFILVPQTFSQFEDPELVVGGFTTLFIVGLILSSSRNKTSALSLPIGLHAGWIIGKMGFNKIAKRSGDNWPWFGTDILIGLGPIIVVVTTGLIVWWWLNYVDPYGRKNRM